jgi:hypothetical protein
MRTQVVQKRTAVAGKRLGHIQPTVSFFWLERQFSEFSWAGRTITTEEIAAGPAD